MKKFLLILGICCTPLSLSLYAQQAKKEKGILTEEAVSLEMYVFNNTLFIKNAPAGAKLQIITIVGNKVREIEIPGGDVSFELSEFNLSRGIYIFKLESMVRKLIIR